MVVLRRGSEEAVGGGVSEEDDNLYGTHCTEEETEEIFFPILH
jgi:hypothetical protein